MAEDKGRAMAMDGFVTRADGILNRPLPPLRQRPAPPAPMNIQPSAVKPTPVKKPKS